MSNRVNFNFYIEDELAEAFIDEWRKQLPISKSKIARAALVEYLKKRGHSVEDTVQDWGGSRQNEDAQEGQMVGEATVSA